MNLTELANLYKNAKGTLAVEKHSYTIEYDKLFEKWKNDEFNFLEIGLMYPNNECTSVRMWIDYFTKAKIHGIDLADARICAKFDPGNRFIFHQVNQCNRDSLNNFISQNIQFRAILDDGAHNPEGQQKSMGILFPYVESGGYFIIEDLHCIGNSSSDCGPSNAWRNIDPVRDYDSPRFIFKNYIESELLRKDDLHYMLDSEIDYLSKNIKNCYLACEDKLLVIEKV